MPDGASIELRRHGNPDGPRVLVSHGNGFATDGYWPFWRHLTADYDLVIYDQRNHGQNPRHRLENHRVARMAEDLELLLQTIGDRFGERPVRGVFHSLSAIVSVVHASRFRWPWEALVLVDPPFCPAPDDPLRPRSLAEEGELSERAAKRRNGFDTPDDLAKRLEEGLGHWVPGAPACMARAILRPSEGAEEAFELSCPGAFESRIFADNSSLNLTPILKELPDCILYLCADPEAPPKAMPGIVNRALHERYGLRYEAVAGATHMLQLERPEHAADRVRAFFGAVGFEV